jgi:pimeloyl-ACP methyl ester carboxylesterase
VRISARHRQRQAWTPIARALTAWAPATSGDHVGDTRPRAVHGLHVISMLLLNELHEQRALLRELDELEHAIASVRAPVLALADPENTVVPFETARRLARALPDARLQLVEGAGHHLPRRAADVVADAIVAFLAAAQTTDVPVTQPA